MKEFNNIKLKVFLICFENCVGIYPFKIIKKIKMSFKVEHSFFEIRCSGVNTSKHILSSFISYEI